jgi:CTP synthase
VNPVYHERLSRSGMVFSGHSVDHRLVEIIELQNHPWFVACQFHPEFRSTLRHPHPLFQHFIAAGLTPREGVSRR